MSNKNPIDQPERTHFWSENRAYREDWLERAAKQNDEIEHSQVKGESNNYS